MPIFNTRWGCRLKELQNARKYRKPSPVADAAGLSSLVGFLNQTAGVTAPREKPPGAAAITVAPKIKEPTRLIPATPPTAAPVAALNKIAFTGRLMSGKDFVAAQAGLTIFSLASPLYALQKFFFGTDDKTASGAREFLQAAGQIGRGLISAGYPLSIQRANFIALVREQANRLPDDLSVTWSDYGTSQDLWLDALLRRVKKHLEANPGARVAVTNARFSNELTRLTAEGFAHFHTMTSATTWSARLQKVGLSPESPACKDTSEQLAASLDQNVIKTLSAQRTGNKLKAIWSDDKVPPPSARLLTVGEFCAMFKL